MANVAEKRKTLKPWNSADDLGEVIRVGKEKPYFDNQYGDRHIGEPQWKPHVRNALSLTNTLPNTKLGASRHDRHTTIHSPVEREPRLRERPPPVRKCQTCPRNFKPQLRTYPQKFSQTYKEWSFYPDGYHYGKRTLSPLTCYDLPLELAIGSKKRVLQPRGGLFQISPGDKSYQIPEYSPDFHKIGSTLPVVCFGGSITRCIPDTFVPLQELPRSPRPTWVENERIRIRNEEISVVKALGRWRPAPPLLAVNSVQTSI